MTKNKKILLIVGTIVLLVVIATICLFAFKDKEKATYIITFNSSGGSAISEQVIEEGSNATKPEDPTREGYLFVGWKYENIWFDFSSTIDKNITLIAEWMEVTEDVQMVTIKFETDGGTTVANQIIGKGLKASVPENPIKEGYTFKGWYYNEVLFDFNTEIQEDIIIVAKWEKVNVSVNNNNNNLSNNNKEENIKVEIPTLTHTTGYATGEQINTKLAIFVAGEYADLDKINSLAGWELYEKVGNQYNLVGSKTKEAIEVTVNMGEIKTYVARAYKLNKKNEKVYSAYSNELVIDNT